MGKAHEEELLQRTEQQKTNNFFRRKSKQVIQLQKRIAYSDAKANNNSENARKLGDLRNF